jgi:hypothetical protein
MNQISSIEMNFKDKVCQMEEPGQLSRYSEEVSGWTARG